jgi:hypothetical protein
LDDILRKLQDRGYQFKLPTHDMTLSYFDVSQGWYVCAGRGSEISTLIVPFGAFIKESRLTIKARKVLRGVPEIRASPVKFERFNSIEPATSKDSNFYLTYKKGKQDSEGISKTSTLSSFNPTCSLKADFQLTQLFDEEHALKSLTAIE